MNSMYKVQSDRNPYLDQTSVEVSSEKKVKSQNQVAPIIKKTSGINERLMHGNDFKTENLIQSDGSSRKRKTMCITPVKEAKKKDNNNQANSVFNALNMDFDELKKSLSLINSKITDHPLFKEDEILEQHPVIAEKKRSGMQVEFIIKKRSIIQQQSENGSAAATTAMFLVDNKKKFSVKSLREDATIDEKTQMLDLQNEGLQVLMAKVSNVKELKNLITEHKSAIVRINDDKIGSHSLIVDKVSKTFVNIRDPYQGVGIKVTREAFAKKFNSEDQSKNVIQINHL